MVDDADLAPHRPRLQGLVDPDAMIVTCLEMREAEEALFAEGILPEELMEDAGMGIAGVVQQFMPNPGRALVFVGKGHNGGDAIVAAGILRDFGWEVAFRFATKSRELSPLTMQKYFEFLDGEEEPDIYLDTEHLGIPHIVIDGLLGTGARGALHPAYRRLATEINEYRDRYHALVFAVDIPSGLDGDTGQPDEHAVRASITVTIGRVKQGLVRDQATNYVVRLALALLPDLEAFADREEASRRDDILSPQTSADSMAVPPRPFDIHKSQAGRVGILAGSRGFTGAAALAASGAARAGAGLVTLFVGEDIYPTLAATVIPEVMVRPVRDYAEVLNENLDAIVLGPGLGKSRASEILTLIEKDPRPMVVDADALNVLAISGTSLLKKCAGPRLLTPHPGEMRRLLDGSDLDVTNFESLSRREVARMFCREHPVTLLYKGARTIVAEEGRPLRYNTTGTPGMATGGCGDVLSGVCATLLARGTTPFDSACIGSWLLGRAAEVQVYESGQSAESLLAGDIAFSLGAAYRDLRNGYY